MRQRIEDATNCMWIPTGIITNNNNEVVKGWCGNVTVSFKYLPQITKELPTSGRVTMKNVIMNVKDINFDKLLDLPAQPPIGDLEIRYDLISVSKEKSAAVYAYTAIKHNGALL